jgi:hypothetical protein
MEFSYQNPEKSYDERMIGFVKPPRKSGVEALLNGAF